MSTMARSNPNSKPTKPFAATAKIKKRRGRTRKYNSELRALRQPGVRFGKYELLDDGMLDLTAPMQYKSMRRATRNHNMALLLKLPTELREQIFREVLGKQFIFIYRTSGSSTRHMPRLSRHVLDLSCIALPKGTNLQDFSLSNLRLRDVGMQKYWPLSRVCRQLYTDTKLMPYSLNTFSFEDDNVMKIFLECRFPFQHDAMTSMQPSPEYMLRYHARREGAFFRKFENIRTVYISLDLARAIYQRGKDKTSLNLVQEELRKKFSDTERNEIEFMHTPHSNSHTITSLSGQIKWIMKWTSEKTSVNKSPIGFSPRTHYFRSKLRWSYEDVNLLDQPLSKLFFWFTD